jgi:hypothetical protein
MIRTGDLFATRLWWHQDYRQALRRDDASSHAPCPIFNTRAGVVVRDRYARNPSGKLSHNRKELLVQPIKQELYAGVLSNCPDELWVVDKSPDVLLWSAKARTLLCSGCRLMFGFLSKRLLAGTGSHDRNELSSCGLHN